MKPAIAAAPARTAVALGLLLTACGLTACGGDGSGPTRLTLDQVNGTWQLQLVETDACTEPAFPGTYYITLAFSAPAADGSMTTLGHWTDDPSEPDRFPLQGQGDLDTGDISLVLWHDQQVSGAIMDGKILINATLGATLFDPRPGYAPVFSVEGCEFTVTGARP